MTPENQCLGEQCYHLAIYPYKYSHVEAAVSAMASQFMSLPYVVFAPVEYNKLLGGHDFVQSSGIKGIFYRPLENADVVVPKDMTFSL